MMKAFTEKLMIELCFEARGRLFQVGKSMGDVLSRGYNKIMIHSCVYAGRIEE